MASWREQGHEVLSLGPDSACDVRTERAISLNQLWGILKRYDFFPDVVFWNDNCRPPSVIGFENLPCPCIGFSIDQYCNPWHVPYSAAFDLLLVAQKDYLSLFGKKDILPPPEWFPLFCNPLRDRDFQQKRDVPASFVGTLDPPLNPGRRPFLEKYRKFFPLLMTSGDYVPVFNRSRLVLNQSAAGEMNFRIFQAAACGSLVLTEDCENGLQDIFSVEREVIVYPRGDAQAAAEISRYMDRNPDRLAQMARAGQEKVHKRHTAPVRAKQVATRFRELLRSRAYKKRIKNKGQVREELGKAFMFLATDTELALPPDHREFYLDLARKYENLHQGS